MISDVEFFGKCFGLGKIESYVGDVGCFDLLKLYFHANNQIYLSLKKYALTQLTAEVNPIKLLLQFLEIFYTCD